MINTIAKLATTTTTTTTDAISTNAISTNGTISKSYNYCNFPLLTITKFMHYTAT